MQAINFKFYRALEPSRLWAQLLPVYQQPSGPGILDYDFGRAVWFYLFLPHRQRLPAAAKHKDGITSTFLDWQRYSWRKDYLTRFQVSFRMFLLRWGVAARFIGMDSRQYGNKIPGYLIEKRKTIVILAMVFFYIHASVTGKQRLLLLVEGRQWIKNDWWRYYDC